MNQKSNYLHGYSNNQENNYLSSIQYSLKNVEMLEIVYIDEIVPKYR